MDEGANTSLIIPLPNIPHRVNSSDASARFANAACRPGRSYFPCTRRFHHSTPHTLIRPAHHHPTTIRMVSDMIIPLNDLLTFLTVSEASACLFCGPWLGCVEVCCRARRELGE